MVHPEHDRCSSIAQAIFEAIDRIKVRCYGCRLGEVTEGLDVPFIRQMRLVLRRPMHLVLSRL